MSIKSLFVIIFILILGIFIYLKVEISGDPNSTFNQTTRFSLASNSFARTVLGLHNAGDARTDYLKPGGPIIIEWFKPQSETEDYINKGLMDKFAALVGKYTGRQTQLYYGGSIADGTVAMDNLDTYRLKAAVQIPSGTVMMVFFTADYSPRSNNALSSTYLDSGMVISIDAHRNFLQNYSSYQDGYFLISMLREFGKQIGMKLTTADQYSSSCIMNSTVGFDGTTYEADGYSEPQDFCQSEQNRINNLKLQFGQ